MRQRPDPNDLDPAKSWLLTPYRRRTYYSLRPTPQHSPRGISPPHPDDDDDAPDDAFDPGERGYQQQQSGDSSPAAKRPRQDSTRSSRPPPHGGTNTSHQALVNRTGQREGPTSQAVGRAIASCRSAVNLAGSRTLPEYVLVNLFGYHAVLSDESIWKSPNAIIIRAPDDLIRHM